MKHICIIPAIFVISTLLYSQDLSYNVKDWEISKERALQEYAPGSESVHLDFSRIKDYDNRIYSHILSINPEIERRTVIIRTKSKPLRDFLFIDNKLFEIMERYDNIDEAVFKRIFNTLKNLYGLPEMNKEKGLSVYTYKNNKTSAMLVSRPSAEGHDVKVYLYSQSLIRYLFMDN